MHRVPMWLLGVEGTFMGCFLSSWSRTLGLNVLNNGFRSPAPVARVSTWREVQCRQVTTQPFNFLGLRIYFKFKTFFYTFMKALCQRFDIFSSPSPRFIISINHCCPSNRVPASAILWESFTIYYLIPLVCPIVNLWLHCNSCSVYYSVYIPQFTTYLPKSCLPLTSWAHYLLKRLLAIGISKILNLYKL